MPLPTWFEPLEAVLTLAAFAAFVGLVTWTYAARHRGLEAYRFLPLQTDATGREAETAAPRTREELGGSGDG